MEQIQEISLLLLMVMVLFKKIFYLSYIDGLKNYKKITMKVFFDYHAFSLQLNVVENVAISRLYFVELNREFCQSKIESKFSLIHKNYYLKNC